MEGQVYMEELLTALGAITAANSDIRRQAEVYFKTFVGNFSLLGKLLEIIQTKQLTGELELAAAIVVKDSVSKMSDDVDANSVEFQNFLKNVYLVQREGDKDVPVNRQLFQALKLLLSSNFVDSWPHLVPILFMDIQQRENEAKLLCALKVLRVIFSKLAYNYRNVAIQNEKQAFNQVFSTILTVAKDIIELGLDQPMVVSLLIPICKIFSSGEKLFIDANFLSVQDTLPDWLALFQHILSHPFKLDIDNDDEDEDTGLPSTKLLNKVIGISLFQNLRWPIKLKAMNLPKNYILKWQGNCLEILIRKLQMKTWNQLQLCVSTEREILELFRHFGTSSLYKKHILPHRDFFIKEYFMTHLCFNKADNIDWYEDITKFIDAQFMGQLFTFDSKGDVYSYMVVLLKSDYAMWLVPIIEAVSSVFACYYEAGISEDEATQRKRDQQMDASLIMFAASFDFRDKCPDASYVERLLNQYVFPLFKSKEKFLRLRACWVVGKLNRKQMNLGTEYLTFSQTAFALVVEALVDPELPVKAFATDTLGNFFKGPAFHTPVFKDFVAENLPFILKQFIELFPQTSHCFMFDCLDILFSNYEAVVTPYISSLLPALIESQMKILSKQVAFQYDLSPSFLVLITTNQLIGRILKCLEKTPDAFQSLLGVFVPLIEFMFGDGYEECSEEGAVFLFYFVCYLPIEQVTPLYKLIERMHYFICNREKLSEASKSENDAECCEDASEDLFENSFYVSLMKYYLLPLERMITRGGNLLFELKNEEGKNYISLLFEMATAFSCSKMAASRRSLCFELLGILFFVFAPNQSLNEYFPTATALLQNYFNEVAKQTAKVTSSILYFLSSIMFYNLEYSMLEFNLEEKPQKVLDIWINNLGLLASHRHAKICVVVAVKLLSVIVSTPNLLPFLAEKYETLILFVSNQFIDSSSALNLKKEEVSDDDEDDDVSDEVRDDDEDDDVSGDYGACENCVMKYDFLDESENEEENSRQEMVGTRRSKRLSGKSTAKSTKDTANSPVMEVLMDDLYEDCEDDDDDDSYACDDDADDDDDDDDDDADYLYCNVERLSPVSDINEYKVFADVLDSLSPHLLNQIKEHLSTGGAFDALRLVISAGITSVQPVVNSPATS